MSADVAYKRILLKLSGEALEGKEAFGIDPDVLQRMSEEIGELVKAGVQVGLVIGPDRPDGFVVAVGIVLVASLEEVPEDVAGDVDAGRTGHAVAAARAPYLLVLADGLLYAID